MNICIRYTLKCIVVTVTNTSNIEEASYVGGEKGRETFKFGVALFKGGGELSVGGGGGGGGYSST